MAILFYHSTTQEFIDFSSGDWIEVDPNSHITKNNTQIDVTGLTRAEAAYVYKDFGADYFDGDFEIEFTINFSSWDSGSYPTLAVGMSNGAQYTRGAMRSANDGCIFFMGPTSGSIVQFGLEERNGGGLNLDTLPVSLTVPYLKYYTLKRTGTTLEVRIYNDSERTSYVNNISVTQSPVASYRNLIVTTTLEDGGAYTGVASGSHYDFKIVSH